MALDDLQHIRDALAPLLSRPGPLTPGELEPYDQLHHLGHRALDNAVARLAVVPGAEAVDIGAGLGGSAARRAVSPSGTRAVSRRSNSSRNRTG